MKNRIYDEKNGLWYEKQGNYFIPYLSLLLLVYETDSYSLTHLALQEGIGHCFLLRNDSQGISPKNVPHLGQT